MGRNIVETIISVLQTQKDVAQQYIKKKMHVEMWKGWVEACDELIKLFKRSASLPNETLQQTLLDLAKSSHKEKKKKRNVERISYYAAREEMCVNLLDRFF